MMTTPKTIGFIGGGHMAKAMIKGFLAAGYPPQKIWVSALRREKLEQFAKPLKLHTTDDNTDLYRHVDIVIFAIKPAIFPDIACQLQPVSLTCQPLLISIAAGIRLTQIQTWFTSMRVVRVMPNLPVEIQQGYLGLYTHDRLTVDDRAEIETLMIQIGSFVWLDSEQQLDAITAIAGSGPAYCWFIFDCFVDTAQKLGLSSAQARDLVLQTVLGSVTLAKARDEVLSDLVNQVCSKGGTTQAALAVFEQQQIKAGLEQALDAAYQRAQTLSQEL